MRNKKGIELTVGTVVAIILVIVAFAIIFFFYRQLGYTGIVDREVCHESVIFRATLPSLGGIKDYVPLKCKTDKICITSGFVGGRCKEFENLKGITTVKVNSKEEIEKVIAQNIISCWGTMGEGKVSLFSQWVAERYGVGTVYPTCVVCNRIAFDAATLKKKGIKLEDVNVMQYMRTRLMPDKQISYFDYLAGSNGMISINDEITIKEVEVVDKTVGEEKVKSLEIKADAVGGEKLEIVQGEEAKALDGAVEASELAIMFMQITAPTHSGAFANTLQDAGLIAAGTYVLAPGIVGTGATQVGKACVSGGWVGPVVCGGILAVLGIYQQGSVAYNRGVTSGYCGDMAVGSEARNGCSVVRTINYNASEMASYCSVIESIP